MEFEFVLYAVKLLLRYELYFQGFYQRNEILLVDAVGLNFENRIHVPLIVRNTCAYRFVSGLITLELSCWTVKKKKKNHLGRVFVFSNCSKRFDAMDVHLCRTPDLSRDRRRRATQSSSRLQSIGDCISLSDSNSTFEADRFEPSQEQIFFFPIIILSRITITFSFGFHGIRVFWFFFPPPSANTGQYNVISVYTSQYEVRSIWRRVGFY